MILSYPLVLGLGELWWHNFEHNRSFKHNAGIIDNLKSIIVQIVQTKACLEEESVNLYINRYTNTQKIFVALFSRYPS